MEYITSKSEMVESLYGMFDALNFELYGGKITRPVIDVSVLSSCAKSRCAQNVWRIGDNKVQEVIFSGEFVGNSNTSTEDLVVEMLRCMVKLYCHDNKIKCTSRGGTYYNSRFKRVAEEHGLVSCGKDDSGYRKYKLTDEMSGVVESLGNKIYVARAKYVHGSMPDDPRAAMTQTEYGIRKFHNYRFVCPKCGAIARSGKPLNILCGDCNVKFTESYA